VSVPVNVYSLPWQLCDLNVPKNCATTTDSVNVINSVIIAATASGTADYGLASQPIANVAANGSVNGATPVLGAGGNAVVAPVGTWPTGIALTPSTGAVSTTASVPANVYSVTYELCDLNVPKHCVPATDTVTVITASILAVPESGTAMAGVKSMPIASVVANDQIDGAQAVLGASGNCKITKVGAWPTGFSLSGQTGAVTVASTVAPGIYDLGYEICDLNVPANCASAVDEVTLTPSVVANAVYATAYAGVASNPIKNVAATDTIAGSPVRLVTDPNGTVATYGSWPAGFTLTPSTGTVSMAATVAAGTYSLSYQLCNIAATQCATATNNVTVEPPIVIAAIAGNVIAASGGVVANASMAIGNVVAHDLVHGAVPVLGTGGNAVVSQAGPNWPSGITINPATGAVMVAAGVGVGTFALQYQLCDTVAPPNCATANVNVAVTPPYAEVSVSPYMTGDIEFDWARDGLFCAACNYGLTNAQVNWTDRNNNLWVNGVNATTGAFTPVSGRGASGIPVDTTAFFWQDWGNGPEWAFSTPAGAPGGNPVSQLVYSRYAPDEPATWEYAGAGVASVSLVNNQPAWNVSFLPGAYTHVRNDTVLPEASQCPSDTVAYALFTNVSATEMYTEPVSTGPGTAPTETPFGQIANNIGERWVACTTWLTYQGDVEVGGQTLQQVFWYDRVTKVNQQITFDPTTKQRALMFRAPEFNGQYVLMTLAGDDSVEIYLQTGTLSNGAPSLTLVKTIYSPDPTEPWMFDPKAFIHCTAQVPQCSTFIAIALAPINNAQWSEDIPNGLAVMNIDPVNPLFNIMVPASAQPPTQRFDPKYFITSQYGPLLYYDSLLAVTANQPYQDQGIYYLNMQLGPPSGPCVGSSAHEGLNPTWPNCTAGMPP
jgi:hypothetical protein